MIRKSTLFGLLCIGLQGLACASYLPQEVRLGAFKHDIRSGCRHHYEKGIDVNAELLWESPDIEPLKWIFSPRPHIGTSINTDGGTNQFYFGITWHVDFLEALFAELAFGGDYNTGERYLHNPKKKALGSHIMFREAVEIGARFAQYHSLSVILDHTSNASLANINPGLTGIGLRYGYRF